MALDSAGILTLIQDQDFMRKIATNAIVQAYIVIGEAASTPNRDERHAKALEVAAQDPLNDDSTFWRAFVAGFLAGNRGSIADAGVAQGATDSTILSFLANSWNDLSGVKAS
jgi:hypothetical protein